MGTDATVAPPVPRATAGASCCTVPPVAEPTLDLAQAKRLMDALYEPGDTIYVCAYHDRNKLLWCQSRLTHDENFSPGVFVQVANGLRQAVATTVGVFAPEAPGFDARRTEDQCVGLSAFGIDIDHDDLAALVPGATAVEEVIPEVVRRLEQAGIPQHALVRSGRGLHVYVLIERVKFTTNEERTRAKDVWFRLTKLLGGASDRYDLSSYLRVPGTANRKGEPVRVEFVEEHTHLDRPRYTLEQVVAAVAHLAGLPAEAAVRKERKGKRAKKTGVVSVGAEMLQQDPWNLHLFGIAMRLDKKLAEARQVSVEARPPKEGKLDRSKNDFHYTCRMLELGLPATIVMAELALTARGSVESEGWRVSTFSAATQKVYPTKRGEKSIPWSTARSGGEALFTGVEEPARQIQRLVLDTFARGERPAPAALEPPALVKVALARPGKGKTRDILHWLSSARGIGTGRLGLCGSMVRELLRHEYIINAAFPEGLEFVCNGMEHQFEPDLPEDHETLWKKLPEKLKQRIDRSMEVAAEGEFQRLWTLEKLKAVVTDPAAFYVNCRHPDEVDRGMEPYEDENGPVLPNWARSWDDPVLRQPRAVLKFRGRPDLCLANRSAKELRNRQTCFEWCDFSACRANGNIKVGGAKTYWTDAPFALLSHKAYETHAVVKPSLNKFDSIVFDELPALVYRYPKLRVSPLKVKNARAVGWDVQPVENVMKSVAAHLAVLDQDDPETTALKTVEPLLHKLESACKRLSKKASDLFHKTMGGKLQRGMVRLERLAPLLSRDEFAALLKVGSVQVDEDGEADVAGADPSLKLLTDLSMLRDFCGDAGLDVFMESDFDKDGEGSLWVCRPVNGWPDLLNGPDGRPRPTVLLDATAGIDPRYLLADQWDAEEAPDGEFPNTAVVLTDAKYRSKSKVKEMGALDLAGLVVEQVMPFLGQMVDPAYRDRHPGPPRLLVVTAKSEMKEPLCAALRPYTKGGKLAAEVAVEHFGGLRGRNDFRDFDAVYLTHLHLYDDAFFFGLELLLREFGEPFDRQWVPKATWYRKKSPALQHRAQVADIYQDTLRIGIRSDPTRRAFIFLPTSDAGLVVRVMRLFRGARLVLSDGEVLESPLARPPPQPETTAAPKAPREEPGVEAQWGKPKHD